MSEHWTPERQAAYEEWVAEEEAGLSVVTGAGPDTEAETPEATAPAGPVLVTLSDVDPQPVSWLWAGRLPLAKVVILDGDPSTGKSTLCLDFAAHVTTTEPWPDGAPCGLADVVLMSAEDGIADTIVPRLIAAGADLRRVHAVTAVTHTDEDGATHTTAPSLPRDIGLLRAAITSCRARLVIIDVLMAYLSGRVDSHRDQDVRGVLSELADVAEGCGCTIVLIRHLNKSGGPTALYRGGGSIGIIGAARAGFLVAKDPDDEGRRIFAATKMNLAAEPPALAYKLVPDPIRDCTRIQWQSGTVDYTADDLLRRVEDEDERSLRDEAVEWLVAYLHEHGGSAARRDVIKAARVDGIAERTLDRARRRAGVVSKRQGFNERGSTGSIWSLLDTLPSPSLARSGRSCQP